MNVKQLIAMAGGFLFVYIVITLTNRPQVTPATSAPPRTQEGAIASEGPITLPAAAFERVRGFALLPLPGLPIDAETSTARFAPLAATGARWVSLRPVLRQALGASAEVPPDATPPDQLEAWRRAIQAAHGAGLAVMLRPMIAAEDGTRREAIAPPDPAAWLASYGRALSPWLALAAAERVELVCVGSNLTQLQADPSWKGLVEGIRGRYTGKLTYAASVDEGAHQRVSFWAELDFVGLDGFFPLTDTLRPDRDQLEAGWKRVADDLEAWRGAGSLPPVLFTAVGVPRLAGGAMAPGRPNADAPLDERAAAEAADALFAALWPRPWFAGMFWHCWSGGDDTQAAYHVADTPTSARLEAGYKAP